MTILLQIAALGYAFVLPGVLIAAVARREWSPAMTLAGGLTLGLLVGPLASFCCAWLLATSVRAPLVLAVATGVSATCGAALALRRRGDAG